MKEKHAHNHKRQFLENKNKNLNIHKDNLKSLIQNRCLSDDVFLRKEISNFNYC